MPATNFRKKLLVLSATYFLKMKHDVKLTDIAKIFVERLHKQVDEL